MRGSIILTLAALVPALGFAQEQGSKAGQKQSNCSYTVGSQSIDVSLGATVCRRQPAPYNDKYSLLRCNPPLDEIDSDVKRGDARCDRYDDRE